MSDQYARDGHIFVLRLLWHAAPLQGDLSHGGHGLVYKHLFVFYFLTYRKEKSVKHIAITRAVS